MVGLTNDQRRRLTDKLPDVANLVLGALALSQFLGDRQFSLPSAAVGITIWSALFGAAFFLERRTDVSDQLLWLLALGSGPLLFATIAVIYDWLARRQDRREHGQRRSTSP